MNNEIPIPLLPFLGACLYGDAPEYYAGLNDPDRQALETQIKLFNLTPWFLPIPARCSA